MPSATAALAVGDADRHGEREQAARDRLEQHQPAVEAELLVPGQPAAREVARGVGEHRDDEDPVQLGRAVEDVVLDRVPQRQRRDEEHGRRARLDRQRHAQRVPLVTERPARRDRVREQLLDRPVDDRDDQEQDRPQDRDALVVDLAEGVAGEREVGERDEAGRRDPDREDPRAPRPYPQLAALTASDTHRNSIVHGNGERASTTSPCRDSSSTKLRLDQWFTWPGVFPRSRRYAPRAMFNPRHSGSRGTDTSRWPQATRAISATVCSGSGTCSSTSIAHASVELAVGERQVLGLHHAVLEVRRLALLPLGLDRRVLEVDPDDAAVERLRPLVREHALAAPDVEHRARRGPLEQLVERALEARHQPLHDRVAGAVLVVRVAGDGALGVTRDACRSQLQRLALFGLAVAGRRGRRSSAPGRSSWRRARSARAGRRARARRGGCARRCAGA